MVRITLYDPQVSARVYSERRAVERSAGSPLAEGLGRLGRALTEREERAEPGNQDKTQALRAKAKMRKEELARLRANMKPGAPDPQGSGKRFLKGHIKRRDAFLRELAKQNPRSAKLAAEGAAFLTEDLAQRATVFEAANVGDALAADINTALTDAIDAVRADPTQRAAAQEDFRATLTALAEDGVDESAVETLISAADRKIANAAFEGRLEEDPEAAREELAAGEFGDNLPAEDFEVRMQKADRAIKVRRSSADADSKVAAHAYRTRFDDYLRLLAAGEVAPDDAFSEEAIRDRMPAGVAEFMVGQLTEASAIAAALAEIQFMSPTQIAGADTGHAAHTRAARLRDRLLGQDPAAFALRNSEVRASHDAWMQARADGDLTAAIEAGRAFASETLALQRHMGVAESDLRILPGELAEAFLADFMDPGGQGPVVLGQGFRKQFGDHWRSGIADLVRAGLPEGHAVLAQMQAPDQRRAAEQLWAEFGTKVEDLREAAGSIADEILREHTAILNDVRSWDGTEPIEPDSVQAQQALRRAYLLGQDGVPPAAAVRQALSEVTLNPEQYAWVHGPAGRVGPEEARSMAQSGVLSFMLGIDPALARSAGSTAQRALAELGRLPELDQSGRERLLQTILSLGPDTAIGTQMLEAFDRMTGAPDQPAHPSVRAAPDDLLPISPIIPRLSGALEEFRSLNPVDRGRRMLLHLESRHLRQATPLIEDLDGTLGFINQALLSDDPAVQMYGAMIASDLAQASQPVFGRLDDDAWRNYDQVIRDWYEAQAPMEIGAARASDRFVTESIRGLARSSDWPEGEEQIVEMGLLISRLPEADDRQAAAMIRRIELTVTPRDPQLARRLVALAHAKRTGPGTAVRTPGGGIVFDPGGMGDMPAEAVPYSSNSDLVLAVAGTIEPGERIPNFNITPPVPEGFVGRIDSFVEIFEVGQTVFDAARVNNLVDGAISFLQTASEIKGTIDEVNREELLFLVQLQLKVREVTDPKNAKEIGGLIGMYEDFVDDGRVADILAAGIDLPEQLRQRIGER